MRERETSDKVPNPVILMPESLTDQILATLTDDPNGTRTTDVCRQLGMSPQELGDAFEELRETGRIRGFGGLWLTPEGHRVGVEWFMAALGEAHTKKPKEIGFPPQRIAQAAGLKWGGKALDRIVAELAEEDLVAENDGLVREAGFHPDLPARQRQFLNRVIEAIEAEWLNVPNPHELAKTLVVPIQAVEEVIRLGVKIGELIQVADQVFYTPHQLQEIQSRLRTEFGENSFTMADLRDKFESSRKYIPPLLEFFDESGFTVRTGNTRVIS